MKFYLNDHIIEAPSQVHTLEDIALWKDYYSKPVALALNDRIIRRENWKVTAINDLDRLTVITAAFGG